MDFRFKHKLFTVRALCILTMWGGLIFPCFVIANQPVKTEDLMLVDKRGQTTARLTTSGEGTPALFFYDDNDIVRISIGLYADGAPSVVLNDEAGQAAAIMRLVESAGTPVLVLKENGQDKLVIDQDFSQKQNSPISWWMLIVVGIVSGVVGVLLERFKSVKVM